MRVSLTCQAKWNGCYLYYTPTKAEVFQELGRAMVLRPTRAWHPLTALCLTAHPQKLSRSLLHKVTWFYKANIADMILDIVSAEESVTLQ